MLRAVIRTLPAIALLLFFAACGSGDRDRPTGAIPVDTPAKHLPDTAETVSRARNRMTDSMLAQIIGYYQNLYGNDSVHLSISRSDTLVELRFADTTTGSDPDKYTGVLFLAAISLVTDVNPILNGDLNGDGVDDLLVRVHTEGGGGGGNIWWDDHFVFLAVPGGRFRLADAKGDGELVGGAGYFFPDAITNGIISGVSNEYSEDDGHCCPSLYYRLKLRLEKDGLAQVSKQAIPKPKSFE